MLSMSPDLKTHLHVNLRVFVCVCARECQCLSLPAGLKKVLICRTSDGLNAPCLHTLI